MEAHMRGTNLDNISSSTNPDTYLYLSKLDDRLDLPVTFYAAVLQYRRSFHPARISSFGQNLVKICTKCNFLLQK